MGNPPGDAEEEGDAEEVAVRVGDAEDVAVRVGDAEEVAVRVGDADDVAVRVGDADDVAVEDGDKEDDADDVDEAGEADVLGSVEPSTARGAPGGVRMMFDPGESDDGPPPLSNDDAFSENPDGIGNGGKAVGNVLGRVGITLGRVVGSPLGRVVGIPLGKAVGSPLGRAVGKPVGRVSVPVDELVGADVTVDAVVVLPGVAAGVVPVTVGKLVGMVGMDSPGIPCPFEPIPYTSWR